MSCIQNSNKITEVIDFEKIDGCCCTKPQKTEKDCGPIFDQYQEFLRDSINKYRKKHNFCFGLSLDEELCLKAEFEANKLLSSSKIRNNFPSHTTRNHITKDRGVCSYGVNLELAEDDFSTVGEGLSVTLLEKIVRTWYNQKQYYNYETGKSEGEERIDDFCQMIWKPCSKLGVAISEKESLLIIYVLFNSVADPEKYFEEIPGLTLLASFDESRKASDREKVEEESSEKKV